MLHKIVRERILAEASKLLNCLYLLIAKHNLTGNCILDSLEGKSESDGDNSMLGINA